MFLNSGTPLRRGTGYTLMEVVVTTALFAVLALGIEQLYVVYGRIVTLQTASIGVALGGSAIMDAVKSAGQEADHVVAAHAFSGVTYMSGTTTVVFELPSVDASGTVIPNSFDYVAVSATGTSAYRLVDAAAGSARPPGTKLLTSLLASLSFSYDNASFPSVASVTADATTSAVVRGQTTAVHLSERVYLRNL